MRLTTTTMWQRNQCALTVCSPKNDSKHKLYIKEILAYYVNNAWIVLLNEEEKKFDYLKSKILKLLIPNFRWQSRSFKMKIKR